MSEPVYRQRKQITEEELQQPEPPFTSQEDPLKGVRDVQKMVSQETGQPMANTFQNAPFTVSGNVPPEFIAAMESKRVGKTPSGLDTQVVPKTVASGPVNQTGSSELESLLKRLSDKYIWEKIEFPSKGKFYTDIPSSVHVRSMTGEEEQILATRRYVKRGEAIDMIFSRCVNEKFATENLISPDRTYLLIYLRGISFTPEYDVEVSCPKCTLKFNTVINLNALEVTECPDNFGPDQLQGILPESQFKYRYRLPTGRDEIDIANYRENKIQKFGEQSEDDTLLYRTALLLEDIEGVTLKKEIQFLLRKLPINDVQHLRQRINNPPFGVNTEVTLMCPSCVEYFSVDLPLEESFFFPREKKEPEIHQ